MRVSILVAALAAGLAACTEITPLRNADGTVDYYVDCEGTLRLESCRAAMTRTCPNGFDLRPASAPAKPDPKRPDLPPPKQPNDGLFRCR